MGQSHNDETLSAPMTVVGMVNGMIGGLILILPVLTLNAGYIFSLIVLAVIGALSYYSSYLCVLHMGDQPDLDYAILRHFNGNKAIKILYDLCVWSNLILIDMLYFELIVIQWIGLIPPHQYDVINPLINGAVLLTLVFVLKYFEFGATTMAYGIISIITYLLFLIWVVATSNQGYNGQQFKAFGSGSGAIEMAAAMGGAYSIQSFFIPVLKKNKNPHKYKYYTLLAYLIGGSAYFYIAYMGSFGIWHRKFIGQSGEQTLEGYFGNGAWEVNIIEGIYLVHLYSVFPEFMLISKKRIFGVFRLTESKRGKISVPQVIYIIVAVGICLAATILKVKIGDIIDINGAVIGFFFIYFLPALLHIKCMYFSKGKLPLSQSPIIALRPQIKETITPKMQQGISSHRETQLQQRTSQSEGKYQYKIDEFLSMQNNTLTIDLLSIENSHYYCDCSSKSYGPIQRALDLLLIVFMVLLGAFIMVNGIYTVAV